MKTRAVADDADDRGKTIRVNMREILDYQIKAKKPDGYRKPRNKPALGRPLSLLG